MHGRTAIIAILGAICWQTCARADKKYALCIGVNDSPEFRLEDGSRPRPLRGAETDAKAFDKLLVEQFGFDRTLVQLIVGKQATLEGIRKALKQLGQAANPDDTVVLYFAGHGTQIRDVRPLDEEDGVDEALFCYDVTADRKNLLIDDELGRWLDGLQAGAVTVILDCCHSGTGTKDPEVDLVPRYLPLVASMPMPNRATAPWSDLRPSTKSLAIQQRVTFYACQPAQQAYERRFPEQHAPARSGQFTHYLIEGLRKQRAEQLAGTPIMARKIAAFVQHQLDEFFNKARPADADRQQPLLEATAEDLPLLGYR